MKNHEFNKEDVLVVARAMVEDCVQSEYQGDYGRHEYLFECVFCNGSYPPNEKFKHDIDCPVLVAQDLLT